MNFTVESPLRVALTGAALRAGVAAVILAIVAQIVPVITTSRQTIISYKLSQARSLQAPWWQRAWLDILLLAITVYGFYTLNQQGSIIAQTVAGDPVQNPLLFWLPALTILAVALLALRLLPQIMRLITTLLAQVNGVTLLQAARYLARTPQQYDMPLLLLIMTVSFSVFTASLARTLDYDLYDRHFYAVGADLNLYTPPNVPGAPGAAGQAATDEASFVFLPISEYETIDGVAEAARVGSYPARARVGEETSNVTFMGIEPHDFAHTAYWRWDFSPSRLGTLMNALGTATEGVLAPQEFLRANGLRGGDIMRLTVRLEGTEFDVERRIVGVFDHFPTWYPETDAPLIVGNLNTLFEEVGSQFPYRVWLDLNEPLDEEALRLALNERQLFGSVWAEPQSDIEQAFLQPERQGLFGLLSVGFMAAAILTVMGLLLYAVFSYRQRLVTLGVLRAVGLSVGSMMRLVAWELALLIFAGIVLGTAFGIGLSRAFIPYLQLGAAEGIVLPPFVVEIAWGAVSQVYVLFAVMFMVSLVTLVLLARRMRLFMVIKLGESV
jgi:putative ABC transport system permease protein